MVFALETYCPASDGFRPRGSRRRSSLPRTGPKVLTLFPAQKLFVANKY